MIKINTIDKLVLFEKIFVNTNDEFYDFLKHKLLLKYKSLAKANRNTLQIDVQTFIWPFKARNGFSVSRLNSICEILDLDYAEHIVNYYSWGSHNKSIVLPRIVILDEDFVEGFALYVAEGDTGFSGKTKSRKFRLTNSETSVINWWVLWLNKYFSTISYYVCAILPAKNSFVNNIKEIRCGDIRESFGDYNKQIKYRVCMDNSIVIDLFLSLDKDVKTACLNDERLAAAYLKGLMAGEGTVYSGKTNYVRIEMKNLCEIEFAKKLFDLLAVTYTCHKRSNRDCMYSLYVGGKVNLLRFHELVGFGCCKKRQLILDSLVKKIQLEKKLGISPN